MATFTHPLAHPVRIDRVARSRIREVDFTRVAFSSVFSDHMFISQCRNGRWDDGLICPFGELSVSPSISALHYGISVFDGMKAHRSPTGNPLLFRPAENARRFQRSAARLAMTTVPESLFLTAIRELVRVDKEWIPPAEAGALYIRTLQFSDDPSIRVKPADRYRFIVLTFPFTAYFSAPVDLLVSEHYVRAFPGGTGDIKSAGNYAAGLLADQAARDIGFNSVMWLDGIERRYIEECGVMNIFFVIGDDVVTPPLTGTILPGVTRGSVITLLGDMGYRVKESRLSIDEVLASHENGTLRECFGTGTAATVSHIGRIRYGERTLELPPMEARTVGRAVQERLLAIMTGRDHDAYGWVERIEG
jgi:branched-chain amino acid aminotransferase